MESFKLEDIMSEKETLDLTMPIFAVYLNVEGLSRQRAEEEMYDFTKYHFNYENIKFILFPVTGNQETKIECIWSGSIDNDQAKKISDKFNGVDDFGKHIMGDSKLTEDERGTFLSSLRNYKLKNLGESELS